MKGTKAQNSWQQSGKFYTLFGPRVECGFSSGPLTRMHDFVSELPLLQYYPSSWIHVSNTSQRNSSTLAEQKQKSCEEYQLIVIQRQHASCLVLSCLRRVEAPRTAAAGWSCRTPRLGLAAVALAGWPADAAEMNTRWWRRIYVISVMPASLITHPKLSATFHFQIHGPHDSFSSTYTSIWGVLPSLKQPLNRHGFAVQGEISPSPIFTFHKA